ncbi:hypothetical protein FRZ06_09475 [Anoxybacterium hadale]|uniref:Uncharacterized protein n=1 Tax=Anoxybacterium hadale TaxID=3408580 RepID=A0ACD1AAU8_9FIRM|nr:hypothetical protein FRZ06_09475 [Clostridiales bacterium]
MITKRSKFWTIVFAFLPGAGHMYNGFMKMGVSFMGLFFIVWALASFINIGAIAFLAPVIWFYAFFDCINRVFQDDAEFYNQEDRFLFTVEQLERFNWNILGKQNLLIGTILVIIGIYAIWNNVILDTLWTYNLLPQEVYNLIVSFGSMIPQLVVGVLIIWAGFGLIMGKKREIENESPIKGNAGGAEREAVCFKEQEDSDEE